MLALIARVNLSENNLLTAFQGKILEFLALMWWLVRVLLSIMDSSIQCQGIYIGLAENQEYPGQANKYAFQRI